MPVTLAPVSSLSPCFLEQPGERAHDVVIEGRGDLRQEFDDRDVAAEAGPDRAELEADRAAPPTTTSDAWAAVEGDGLVARDDRRPSNLRPGSSTGAEPVAMTKFSAVRRSVPEAAATETRVRRGERGLARRTATFRAFARAGDAADQLCHDRVLALHERGQVDRDAATLIPWAAACVRANTSCSDEWRSALLGMQPTFRQVPPSVARLSTSATLRPSCAARNAHDVPAGPRPDHHHIE
jgi:hypothetical protein